MHLVGSITGAAASLIVDVTTGLPTVPFTLLLDPGASIEEVVTVTAVGGTTLTVTRGVGGTSAQAHDNGAEVRHAYYGQDFQDSRDHEASTTAHGATGAVVGTTNAQTLTNKTLTAPVVNTPTLTAATAAGTTTVTPLTVTMPLVSTADAFVVTLPSPSVAAVVRVAARGNVTIKAMNDLEVGSDVAAVSVQGGRDDTVARDLQRWLNWSGAPVASIDPAGNLTAANFPDDTGWINATLSSGWTPVGIPGNTMQYRRLNGIVYIQGAAGTTGAGATAFTLPVGFRPAAQKVLWVDGSGVQGRIQMTAGGVVGQVTPSAITNICLGDIPPFPADA